MISLPGRIRNADATPGGLRARALTTAFALAVACTAGSSPAQAMGGGLSGKGPAVEGVFLASRGFGGVRTWFDQQSCEQGSKEIFSPSAEEKPLLGTNAIDLASAHKLSQGAPISIAVVDSGVAGSSPSLAGATIEAGYDTTGSGNAQMDNVGHGTAVASIIVGQVGAAGAIDGVAPRATIVPVKIVDAEPRGAQNEAEAAAEQAASVQRMAAGIEWAAKNPSVHIITVSASVSSSDPRLEAAVALAVSNNKVVLAAAGNASDKERRSKSTPTASADPNSNLRYPAAYPGVIGVTAVDSAGDVPKDDVLHSAAVDIAAPGMNMVVANGATGVCLAATQAPATSYATAYVAGAAALVRSYNDPSESAEMTAFRLFSSARRPSLSTRDDTYGWGIVDPYGAMTLIDDGQLPGPDSPMRKRLPVKPTAGSDVPPAPHDVQKVGRNSAAIWISGAVGITVVLLMVGAGRSRMARREGGNEKE